jgi:dTDP-4-dehydrorhamnose reductase
LSTRVRDGRHGESFDMANDQTVCPTATDDDLSKAVHAMIAPPRLPGGIYHLVNEGDPAPLGTCHRGVPG